VGPAKTSALTLAWELSVWTVRRLGVCHTKTPLGAASFDLEILRSRLRCVLFANYGAKAHFLHASEQLGSNIRAARVVAEILNKLFFATFGIHKAGFDRYLGNREPLPSGCLHYLTDRGLLRK
jgi:hypothetical protein